MDCKRAEVLGCKNLQGKAVVLSVNPFLGFHFQRKKWHGFVGQASETLSRRQKILLNSSETERIYLKNEIIEDTNEPRLSSASVR